MTAMVGSSSRRDRDALPRHRKLRLGWPVSLAVPSITKYAGEAIYNDLTRVLASPLKRMHSEGQHGKAKT